MPKMIYLIRKDIMLIRRYLWLILIYTIIFSGFIQGNNSTLLYSLLPGMVLILAIGPDMSVQGQQFLISLPVKRNYLVLSKYGSSFIIIFLSMVICLIMNIVTDMTDYGAIHLNIKFVAGMLISLIWFMSLYLPLYYWLGLKGGQFLNVTMMIIIMGGNGMITSLLSSNDMAIVPNWGAMHPWIVGTFVSSATVLAVVISYLISFAIYRKRDL